MLGNLLLVTAKPTHRWHAVHAQAFTHPEKTIVKGPLHVKHHGLGGVGGGGDTTPPGNPGGPGTPGPGAPTTGGSRGPTTGAGPNIPRDDGGFLMIVVGEPGPADTGYDDTTPVQLGLIAIDADGNQEGEITWVASHDLLKLGALRF